MTKTTAGHLCDCLSMQVQVIGDAGDGYELLRPGDAVHAPRTSMATQGKVPEAASAA